MTADSKSSRYWTRRFPRLSWVDLIQFLHLPWMRTQEVGLYNHCLAEGGPLE